MSDQANSRQPIPKPAKDSQPYPPSFVDLLMAWVERLPGPAWGFYVIVTIIFVAMGHGLYWLDGAAPLGQFNLHMFVSDSLTIYGLALLHYLNKTAPKALKAFRPALGRIETEYDLLEYELTVMPRRTFLVATLIGILLAIVSFASYPSVYRFDKFSFGEDIFRVFQSGVLIVQIIGIIANAIRQMKLIVRIHQTATNINLYESKSHHAFSQLTVRTALGLVFPVYYYLFSFYLFIPQAFENFQAFEISMIGAVILAAVAVFVLPLYDMRRRLAGEKQNLIIEVDHRFETTTRKLHEHLDAHNFEKMDDFNRALASLVIEKDTLKKISTWPWEAETMRGFLSSVGLPILLWLITSYLGRFFE